MAGLLGQNTSGGLLSGLLAPMNRGATPEALRRKQEEERRMAMMAQSRPQPASVMGGGESALQFLLGGTEGVHRTRERRRAEALRPQQEARMAQLRGIAESMGPAGIAAFETNPEEFGKALSSRLEGRTLDQGDVYMSGETPGYAAPFEAAPGSAIFDPRNPNQPIAMAPQENKVAGGALVAPDGRVLYRGPQVEGVASTADAFYTPEVEQGQGGGAPAIVRQARPDAVTLAPGGEVVSLDAQGNPVSRIASSQARPISDADQAAIARADNQITSLDTSLSRAAAIAQQIESGELNLGPLSNTIGGIRNNLGMSDQNSLNYDALMSWAKEARNAILQANTGVQTDQDAIRELDTILSSSRDERIVSAAVRRFIVARSATKEALQRDIARRTGGGQGGGDAQGNRLTLEQATALPPGTRFVGTDGVERVRR